MNRNKTAAHVITNITETDFEGGGLEQIKDISILFNEGKVKCVLLSCLCQEMSWYKLS